MKKLYATTNYSLFFKNPLKFLIIVFLFTSSLYNGHGQVREPFQARTSNANPTQTIYSVKGDFAMIGNTNLTLVNYGTNANNYGDMEFVDMDGTAVPGNSTFNSSSATLQFSAENGASPECSNIIYAGLYWTGRGATGLTEQEMRTVKLKGPNDSNYETYTTTNEIRFPGDDRMYVGYIEVTDQVEANGIGEYFVADIATSEGDGGNTGYYGGWGMVVVYENSKMNWRDITIFDGYAYIPGNQSVFYDINISGFNAVQSGDVSIKLGVMAGEGDVAVTGDYFEIQRQDDLTFERLSHSSNTTGNFFNSSINTGVNPRSPDLANNTGVDIAMFNIDNTGNGIIDNNQTSTTIRYGSTRDSYVIFNVAFAVDAYVPEPEVVITNTSINGNPPSGTNNSLEPSQNADFTIEIKNKGTEAINDAIITIPLSEAVDQDNVNITLPPVVHPSVTPNSNPIFDPNIGPFGAIVWDIGDLPVLDDINTILATLEISFTITTDCEILSADDFDPKVTVTGNIAGTGAVSGVSFIENLILGYEEDGQCEGEPITGAIEIPIDYIDYINEAPTASNPEPINITCVDDIPALDPLVVTDEADNSGIPPIVAFVSDVSDDEDCPEVITRTYSVTDDCGNSINVEQIITISPVPLSVEGPEDYDAPTCDFTDQDAVNTAFSDWVAEQSAAITISGGCDPQLSNDSASATIPLLCDGGTATVTWTITDLCETIEVSADFEINAPETVAYDAPEGDSSTASEFDDPDANVAQQNLDDDIAAWVTAQNNAINSSLSGGCSPTITNNFVDQSIAFCASGSITITWTVEDLCGTTTPAATYTYTQPNGIDFTEPTDETVSTCDFDGSDPIAAQTNLDNDIAAWVTEQTNIITNSISTGSPEITNNYNNESINLCEGGSITVTWTIDDICANLTTEATYTVNPTTDVSFTNLENESIQSCNYENQDAIDTAFNDWVNAQTLILDPTGGCSPEITNNSASISIPELCSGGTATVTWTITDLCETITESADFQLIAPEIVEYNAPEDDSSTASEFDDPDANVAQQNLDDDIAAWVIAQNNAINSSFSGGCSPTVTNNFVDQSIAFCASGSITITWTVEDLCGTTNATATYSFTQPDGINYSSPSGKEVNTCDFYNEDLSTAQNNLNTDIAAWVTEQTNVIVNSISGGSPEVTNNYNNQTIDLCEGGSINVTWTIDDICENINTSATYTVNPADDLTYTAPSDLDAQSCDYADQTAVNEAFNNWVATQTAAIAPNQGCSPVLSDNSDSVSIPQLCDGGTATVTWTINDLCEGPIELSADFDLEQPVPVAYTAPSDLDAQSCDYTDQAAVNEAFNNWVAAQTAAIAPNGGCSPVLGNNSDSVSIPQLCDGGTATVTWTINDLCEEPIELSANFDLEQPVPVTYSAPSDFDAQSCDYADQTAVNEAFNNWVAAQTAAIAPNGGCSPVLGNNSDSVSIPQLCDGGTATVTWTITDLCIDTDFSADFNLEKPEDITHNQPNDLKIEACNYTDQEAINSAFNDWVAAQTAAIAPNGGCNLTYTNTSAEITIPQFCEGGIVTVTWTISDLCDTVTESADFEVIAPQTVEYNAPQNDSSTASEFDHPDANIAQQNLDDDIAAWVTAQNEAITNSLTGGCSPTVTNNFTDQSISFCSSGSITIAWTVEDACSTTTPTATYTFTQPDGISFTDPNSKTVNTCDFFNEDAQIAQNELNDAISTWVNEQTDIINNSLSGGSPDVTHDYNNEPIDLCEGGSVTVNWTIDDICETINIAATYNVVPADAITHTAPTDLNAQSCDYADQNELNEAFNTWVTEQTEAFAITGGCSPTLTDNSAAATIPQLCDGGTATVTWSITDLCETFEVSADFIITSTATATFTDPTDDTSDACEFGTDDLESAQQNLDADLVAWVNTQTQNINDSFSGGCSPTVSNDFENQTIDFCTSEAITVNWEITDLCDTIKVSATYTYTAPDAPSFVENLPTDVTVECDAVPTADVLTASNSCGVIDVNYEEDRTDGDCPSTYTLLRTWSATNICGVVTTHQQTITVQDTTAPVLSLPNNVTAECSDDLTPIAFGEATATDNCDANPVITYEDKITNGSCPGDYTIIRTWTATDACGNVANADQTISTSDTTAPVFDQTTLPGNVVVECSGIPEPEILTATDNCGTAIVTVDDAITEGNCAGNYVITRSYTATDECGITNTHVQTITVQDTTPPVFVEDFPLARIVVECDAIPTPETLTATDTCGSATVSVSDTRTDGTCTNNYILARTWTAEDECGLTTTFTQIITVQDTTPPTFVETLPRDVTVECDAIPDAETITATDNCGDAAVTVNDVRTDGSCPNSYTITRTYTATDECDLTTTHTQIITVQDTTAPVPTTAYEETISTSCIDIEAAPELEFADNCSTNVIVEFEETSTFEEGVFADYQIIRTWTVRDACNNEAVYTQTINVALDVIETQVVADDRCFDDGPVNLRDYLADNVTSGTWEIIEGNPLATIEGDIFDPTNLEDAYTEEFNPNTDGITYVLRFTGFEDGCMNVTDVTMVIDAKCKVLPCGESDVIISKAITPNGDGHNETFDIEGIDLCGFVAEVKIFNRWGALVYESNNYTLGSLRTSGLTGDWDGSAPKSSFGNAGKLPNGTYYYIINLRDSGLSPLTGPIYLGTK